MMLYPQPPDFIFSIKPSLCKNCYITDLEVILVEQTQCRVTEFRLSTIPAVLLQEERWILLKLVQFPECVIQCEG